MDTEVCLKDASVSPIYAWKELTEAQLQMDDMLYVPPLLKTEQLYENCQDQVPKVT